MSYKQSEQRSEITGNGTETESTKTVNRRQLLQISGAGLATASLPFAVVGKTKGAAPSAVDTSDPQSLNKFVRTVLTADSKQEVRQLWQQLGTDQVQAVSQYMDEHSTTEIGPIKTNTEWDTVATDEGSVSTVSMESDDVSTEAFSPKYNVPVKRKTAGVLVYQMNHVMEWGKNSSGLFFIQDRSYGAGKDPGNIWHDLRQSYFDHTPYQDHVNSYITREYRHDVHGVVCNEYYAKVDLRGFRDGSLEVIRKNPNFGKHDC